MSAVELEAVDTFIRDTSSVAGSEFEHLGNNLGTTHIKRELAKGRDEIFEHDYRGGWSLSSLCHKNPEMRAKYQDLFPAYAERSKHDIFSHFTNAGSEFYPAITFDTGTKEQKEH